MTSTAIAARRNLLSDRKRESDGAAACVRLSIATTRAPTLKVAYPRRCTDASGRGRKGTAPHQISERGRRKRPPRPATERARVRTAGIGRESGRRRKVRYRSPPG